MPEESNPIKVSLSKTSQWPKFQHLDESEINKVAKLPITPARFVILESMSYS